MFEFASYIRIKIIENRGIFAAYFLNIILDLLLFFGGYSWTPILYEDLLIFSALFQGKGKNITGIIIGTILLITKLLFFNFYLTLSVLIGFWFVKLFIFILFGLIIYLLINIIKSFKIIILTSLFTLSSSLFYYFIDKKISSDRFIASYSSHFLGTFNPNQKIQDSNNKVFKLIKNDLILNKGVILVNWESLGVPLNQELISELRALGVEEVSELPWEGGSTTPAEARYLCGTNHGFKSKDCLPNLVSISYAFHGNALSYFNRSEIYKEYGFQNAVGRKSLLGQGYKDCSYAYSAICDEDLFKEIFGIANTQQCKGFFYGMSIDSHYPYSKYKRHDFDLFSDLNRFIVLAQAFKSIHRDCSIYIVGDHPPPLSSNFSNNKILFIKI